jgi:heme-degrading monooxygenase HmoA
MFARTVSLQLKPNTAAEMTQRLDNEVIPMLRKQKGFHDAITLLGTGGTKVCSISLWDDKQSAETYNRETYPEVLKILGRVTEGTPQVETYEVTNSTLHAVAAAVRP